MLYEIRNVRQRKGEGKSRWFTDEYWDLFVWFDEHSAIVQFQLTYGKPAAESSITWDISSGFSHAEVHTDNERRGMAATPILVDGGSFAGGDLCGRFYDDSVEIDPNIASFVYEKLMEYTLE